MTIYVLVRKEGEYSNFEYEVLGSFTTLEAASREAARLEYRCKKEKELHEIRRGYRCSEPYNMVIYSTPLGGVGDVERFGCLPSDLYDVDRKKIDEWFEARKEEADADALDRLRKKVDQMRQVVKEDEEFIRWYVSEDTRKRMGRIPEKVKKLAPLVAAKTGDKTIVTWVSRNFSF